MNPLAAIHYPTSSDADLDRLQALVEQLAGFDDTLSVEWLDGAMTALAAGPRQRPVAEWRERLFGETWTRTFADPPSEREATAVLQARWNVLLRQLDPEALMEAPDDLRLAPVMLDWSDGDGDGDDTAGTNGEAADAAGTVADAADVASIEGAGPDATGPEAGGADVASVEDAGPEAAGTDGRRADASSAPGDEASSPTADVARPDEDRDAPRTGEVWAIGFMEVVASFEDDWPTDPATLGEQAEPYADALGRIALLGLAEEADIAEATTRLHADVRPTRDELIEDALHSVQDLRVFFVENAPKPETRRVGPQPGRNDPCPCGSGLKFKKCHGRA